MMFPGTFIQCHGLTAVANKKNIIILLSYGLTYSLCSSKVVFIEFLVVFARQQLFYSYVAVLSTRLNLLLQT